MRLARTRFPQAGDRACLGLEERAAPFLGARGHWDGGLPAGLRGPAVRVRSVFKHWLCCSPAARGGQAGRPRWASASSSVAWGQVAGVTGGPCAQESALQEAPGPASPTETRRLFLQRLELVTAPTFFFFQNLVLFPRKEEVKCEREPPHFEKGPGTLWYVAQFALSCLGTLV